MSWMSTYVVVEISPDTTTRPVLTSVSHATRPFGSSRRTASRTPSEIWSATLSGCPSVTDSEVNRYSLSDSAGAFMSGRRVQPRHQPVGVFSRRPPATSGRDPASATRWAHGCCLSPEMSHRLPHAVWLVLLVVGCGTAQAATVGSTAPGSVGYAAADGETNDVHVSLGSAPDHVLVRDAGAPLEALSGCISINAHSADC